MDQRTGWHQRIHAVLYHHGLPERSWLVTTQGRAWLARLELPAVARQAVDLALRTIDFLDGEVDQLDATLARIARGQPGCQALMGRYGIGWLTAVSVWAEFGDVRRFANSRQAVRFTGLDITVAASDTKRARGHLARQGPPVLRWALHEAAMCAARPGSPVRPTTPCVSSATRRWSRSCCDPPPDRRSPRRAMGTVDQLMWCGRLPDAPAATRWSWTAPIERAAHPHRGTPITHHVAGACSEHRDKEARLSGVPPSGVGSRAAMA